MCDRLYVEDHARALNKVVTEGKVEGTCDVGEHNEKRSIDVEHALCVFLDEL